MKRRDLLAMLLLVAFLIRLVAAFQAPLMLNVNDDGWTWDLFAWQMAQSKSFSDLEGKPITWTAPFYCFFLSSIYSLFGHNLLAVRVIQSLMGGVLCVLIFLLTERLLGKRVAYVSALLAVFYRPFVILSTRLLTETLFTFCVILELYILCLLLERPRLSLSLLGGIVAALCALTRPGILLFPLFALLGMGSLFIRRKFPRHIIRKVLCGYLIAFLIPIGLWSIRNYRVEHRFILISSHLGRVLYSSYLSPPTQFGQIDKTDPAVIEGMILPSKSEKSAYFLRKTLLFLRENPLAVVRLLPSKILLFWSPFDWEILRNGSVTYNSWYGFLFPFFLLGFFMCLSLSKDILFLIYGPIFYFLFIASVFYGSPRFRLPIEPLMLILASYGLMDFYRRFKKFLYPFALSTTWAGMNIAVGFFTSPLLGLIKDGFRHFGFFWR